MQIKEMTAKAGAISDYLGYIVLLFGWYLLNHAHSMIPGLSGTVFESILPWFLQLLAAPIVFVVLIGGMQERQKNLDDFERKSFFSLLKLNFSRMLGASLLALVINFVLMMIIVLVSGMEAQISNQQQATLGIVTSLISTINLFWFSAIVVERKIFRGLFHSIKLLLTNPAALAIGLVWAVFCIADAIIFDPQGDQVSLAMNIARSAVFAILRVLATMYILVIYQAAWGREIQIAQNAEAQERSSANKPGEGLAKASLGFTFVSFVPLLHLVALILGAIALKRSQRFQLRAAIACWVGGFFSIVYALVLAGTIAGQAKPILFPNYAFLADGKAEIDPYVQLLDQGAYQEIQLQLDEDAADPSRRDWAYDSALALAKYEADDLNGALADFYTALQKQPERSEFYFYYGIALLDNEQTDMALEQFNLAVKHSPKLAIAETYIGLLQNTYEPNLVTNAVTTILVLIILFALHEYGHAFAAWKLGDNTAKDLGRLTLNPIAHIDLFGSILLPAVLLFQGSGAVFGWAKPVPVNPENFKNPNKDQMVVSFAGPAVNLMLAMVCFILLAVVVLIVRLLWPGTVSLNLAAPFSAVSMIGPPFTQWILAIIVFLKQMFFTSLILGFFNLLPVPPLDGSWIFSGLLPQKLREFFEAARRFSFVFFMLLVMTPLVGYFLSVPIGLAWVGLNLLISTFGFG